MQMFHAAGGAANCTIEYRGAYRQYTNAPAFDGLDQFLQVNYQRSAASRHLTLDLKNTLGTTTLANGAFSYFSLASLDRLASLPTSCSITAQTICNREWT